MPHELEKPGSPADLYRALGEDVSAARPILTGDVFTSVEARDADGTSQHRTIMILDHPCSLRTDGVNLAPRLTVAEVRTSQGGSWRGNYGKIFLPSLTTTSEGTAENYAAFFDSCFLISPERLEAGERIACLSHHGINLLLQRRVMHFSRVVVPTFNFQEANQGVYEEADVVEDWCISREDDGVKPSDASLECANWLKEEVNGRRRQDMLKDAQQRSTVRKQMRDALKSLRQSTEM
ncbi:hypothetical protein ABT389_25685 [Streptomyces bacillaris]|uniref:hypothetical protein n=1 Tax=Streptomyces bacillaris TaxID=68179 RepID=UPI0033577936